MNDVQQQVLDHLVSHPLSSSGDIFKGLQHSVSVATVKRILTALLSENYILSEGKGKGTKYRISPAYSLFYPVTVDRYFEKEIDERRINENFNLQLIQEIFPTADLFTAVENKHLTALQQRYTENIAKLSADVYAKELERLAIDLSWKSSQIEGNTYTLLETERLLKEKQTAEGKPKDDATMLLNHKEAISFIIENPGYVIPLIVSRIEDIHSLLIKDLGVDRNVRQRRVGISGTNYRPLDNEYQIREALQNMCELINKKENVFEKALLALMLLSYIQPFNDGNKRTARIISNAILIAHHYCPISFRTVDSIVYKKAMLIFYEQNNIQPFKQIFISQFEFAVNTYF